MQNLKENERELVKLVNYFSRKSQKLINEGKLGAEHAEVSKACEHLITQVNAHAALREQVLLRRDELKSVVKDNAACPKCNSNSYLKLVDTELNEKGWKSNRYRCRRCNIEFTWNRPNNPWDMAFYMQEVINMMEGNLLTEPDEEVRNSSEQMLAQTKQSLQNLQDIISTCDAEYAEMKERDAEMDKMIKEFKRYLLIEKAKMEAEE
jgi:hypothetical protein